MTLKDKDTALLDQYRLFTEPVRVPCIVYKNYPCHLILPLCWKLPPLMPFQQGRPTWSKPAPLLEEKRDAGRAALITDSLYPGQLHGSGFGAALSANNDPL